MAETLISPGVLPIENDNSFVAKRPVKVGAAIIGPTVKGPVEVPTIVTTYSEYVNKFGTTFVSGSSTDSQVYSYFTSVAAYNYFVNGGESLLVARVVNTSSGAAYTPATSSIIINSGSTNAFILETLSEGIIMNSDGAEVSGSLENGTSDNVRWQIVNANSSSGTFDLLIRRGDDNPLQPIILEQFTGCSLDPNASNYVARVVGDERQVLDMSHTPAQIYLSGSYVNRSNYVRVSQVLTTTPNLFDNNGIIRTQYTGSIIITNTSGAFGAATGTIMGGANFYEKIDELTNSQGLVGTDYDNMITLLDNKDDYQFNVLLTPGLYDQGNFTNQISTIISNTKDRGDNIFILDGVAFNKSVSDAVSAAATRNTSYAASYWPWVQVVDPGTGNLIWVPASTVIAGVYAYNDSVAEPWFAPAGINRGGLSQVVRAEKKLSQSDRDTLYTGKVNPIATFPGTGVVVYGQKTLQTKASALDRVNVRRLLIALKSYISQVSNNLVFEQNSIATRNNFLAQVNPYLTSVQQRQGLYAYKVVMDETNNTGDVVDRNELIGNIYIQPTKTAEFIYLNFNITPTGVSFA